MTHQGSPPRRATRRRARISVSAVMFLTTAFCGGMLAAVPPAVTAYAADTPVAASLALNEPLSSCNSNGFGGGTLNKIARADPQWVPVHQDAGKPFPNDDPTILEGTVMTPAQKGNLQADSTAQAPSEVAEEDVPWSHYTHDKTFDVIPDIGYQHLLSQDANGVVEGGQFPHMEVEADNGSQMTESDGSVDRELGSLPEFVWPSVGDRVWTSGRWVFDCGHPGGSVDNPEYTTEIHPPRVLATFRLNHCEIGCKIPGVTGYETNLPVTEADIFATGNGGGANDYCNLINRHILGSINLVDPCTHTGQIIPINDRNYVFDVYPPGTDYAHTMANGTFPVHPPSSEDSLQYVRYDYSNQIGHRSGSDPLTDPILCLVDDTTGAPTQNETACPAQPARPTRVRVILPFQGSTHDSFAGVLLLGWDSPPTTAMHTYQVRLHRFVVDHNGEGELHLTGGDWRVFVDVAGQWQYVTGLSPEADTDACNHHGTITEDSLTGNNDGDCYSFDSHPWTVTVTGGMPLHIATGGYESDPIDGDFCRSASTVDPQALQALFGIGCDPTLGDGIDLAAENDDRIGTFEFDAGGVGDYSFTTVRLNEVPGKDSGVDGTQYSAEYIVTEIPQQAPPTSTLSVGAPSYVNASTGQTFVTSATPVTFATQSAGSIGFQYRYRRYHYVPTPTGGTQLVPAVPLPTFASDLPFPLHWTRTDYQNGPRSVPINLNAYDGGDGIYILMFSAQTGCATCPLGFLTEPRHSSQISLDNTPPVITIAQPAPTTYTHSQVLTLSYTVDDGGGSGVQSFVPTMDGQTTLDGHGLQSGQAIDLLTELSLGSHTFRIDASDNLGHADFQTVTFTIVVTPESIKGDVKQFFDDGKIKNSGLENALLASLDAAAARRAAGDCAGAANIYQAFINQVTAQSGKGIDPDAAAIMISDAQYLIAHCP